MNKLVTIIILLILSLLGGIAAARPCVKALAAPRSGTVQFGRHFDLNAISVYPVQNRFPAGKSPLYAARFTHPARSTYVTVALSAVFGASTELKALERDYVDEGTTQLMGWLPKPNLQPGVYVLTVRNHGRTLASGSFRVVKSHAES